jgi:hypothetical protein
VSLADDQEQQLRIELMTVQIDQGRLNMDRLRQEIRAENRKFVLQLVATIAASVAAGAGALGLILHLMGKI